MFEPALTYRLPDSVMSALETAPTLSDIEAVTSRFLNDIGFSQYAYHLESRDFDGVKLRGYFSNFDSEWIARYLEQNYVKHDLLQIESRRTVIPFTWLPRKKQHIPRTSAQVFSEAQDFGIRDGIAIPVHGPTSFALMTVVADGSARERERTLAYSQEAVTILALHVHERASAILEAQGGNLETDANVLTPRERECVRWVAVGKTSGEIAQILGVAEGTVSQHIANVRSKLRTPTRTQAAVRAMHFSLIEGF